MISFSNRYGCKLDDAEVEKHIIFTVSMEVALVVTYIAAVEVINDIMFNLLKCNLL